MRKTDRGAQLLSEARSAFELFRTDPGSLGVEEIQALRAKARSAVDWLEDTSQFEAAHRLLDEVGAFVRATRAEACELLFEDGAYYQVCPVKLAHRRIGLSPTFVIRWPDFDLVHIVGCAVHLPGAGPTFSRNECRIPGQISHGFPFPSIRRDRELGHVAPPTQAPSTSAYSGNTVSACRSRERRRFRFSRAIERLNSERVGTRSERTGSTPSKLMRSLPAFLGDA